MEVIHHDIQLKPGMETVACDLCHSIESELIARQRDLRMNVSKEEFTIVRCLRCRLIYLNPRPSRELLGSYYPKSCYSQVQVRTRPQFQQQAKKISARVKRWVLEDYYGYPSTGTTGWGRVVRRMLLWPDKTLRELKGRHPLPWRGEGKVLDVGCGTGGNLKTLQDQGWDPYGIDISEEASASARQLVGANIHTGTLESAPFPPKLFDLVLMNHSLEHLPSPVEALRQVHHLLKDDGILVISVPNMASFESALFGRWWLALDLPRHFYYFDKRTIGGVLKQAGFQLSHFRTGVTGIFFMESLERFWEYKFQRPLPLRTLVYSLLVKPVSFIAGHLGYGTEMTVYAVKQQNRAATPRAV